MTPCVMLACANLQWQGSSCCSAHTALAATCIAAIMPPCWWWHSSSLHPSNHRIQPLHSIVCTVSTKSLPLLFLLAVCCRSPTSCMSCWSQPLSCATSARLSSSSEAHVQLSYRPLDPGIQTCCQVRNSTLLAGLQSDCTSPVTQRQVYGHAWLTFLKCCYATSGTHRCSGHQLRSA
jgi:hypothetical protein